jgi:two-component system, cell cycle response regulator DivK
MSTMLLIEDDRSVVRIVKGVLEQQGYTVCHAERGLTGLRIAREQRFDIILVDMDLPDLEGKVVVLQLRSGIVAKSTPIVAFTAETGAKAKRLALAVGCKEFISKPIDMSIFPHQIKQILNNEAMMTY